MFNWKLRWNFNSESYQPDSIGRLSFYIENFSEELIFVSDVGIKFDWMKQTFYHFKLDENEGKLVRPKKTRFITNIGFKIPQNVSGQRFYTIYFHGYVYNNTPLSQKFLFHFRITSPTLTTLNLFIC